MLFLYVIVVSLPIADCHQCPEALGTMPVQQQMLISAVRDAAQHLVIHSVPAESLPVAETKGQWLAGLK